MDEKYRKLIEKLIEKTKANKLRWEETGNNNCYLAKILTNSVTIQKDENPLTANTVALTIIDVMGKTIDKQQLTIMDQDYNLLDELYKTAKRSTTQIDQALDTMLNSLDLLG